MFKKIFIPLFALALLAFGGIYLLGDSSGEFRAIADQLNPLVKESSVYVKTQKPDSVNGYGTASYTQTAAYEDGKTRKITFNGINELKVDRYLKLTTKGAHVETYEEISKDEVPEKALEKIDK
ncbi:hypothetical protein BG261_05670 [Floricoccus tropicus]|uniref:YxeA family protein n=1 Tax=Floricoccus tropicus TaxID=1859473 RepID=A0A1E8GKU8_9LACT|nr:YxeA family protein [Floricoccus tropicus]OFI48874.1 hypothetical protein BG261_05670 [Floricoccus tropicus]